MNVDKYQQLSIFGHSLKAERKRMGETQLEFALATGISSATQIAYERGSRTPDISYVFAAVAHGADLDLLMTGKRRVVNAGINLNWDLLETIVQSIEDAEIVGGKKVSAKVRAQLIRVFYMHFSEAGEIDRGFFETALKLSSVG